jgi:hypothetical protein
LLNVSVSGTGPDPVCAQYTYLPAVEIIERLDEVLSASIGWRRCALNDRELLVVWRESHATDRDIRFGFTGVSASASSLSSVARDHCSSRVRDGICWKRRSAPYAFCEQRRLAAVRTRDPRRTIMKTIILSAILAMSVLASIAAPASAADPQRGPYSAFSTGQGS